MGVEVVTLLFFCHGESNGFSRLFINLVSLSFVGHGGKRGWFCCVSVVMVEREVGFAV